VIYLNSAYEGKSQILERMSTGIVSDGEAIEIAWNQPYSFLMKSQFLTLKERTGKKVRERTNLLP